MSHLNELLEAMRGSRLSPMERKAKESGAQRVAHAIAMNVQAEGYLAKRETHGDARAGVPDMTEGGYLLRFWEKGVHRNQWDLPGRAGEELVVPVLHRFGFNLRDRGKVNGIYREEFEGKDNLWAYWTDDGDFYWVWFVAGGRMSEASEPVDEAGFGSHYTVTDKSYGTVWKIGRVDGPWVVPIEQLKNGNLANYQVEFGKRTAKLRKGFWTWDEVIRQGGGKPVPLAEVPGPILKAFRAVTKLAGDTGADEAIESRLDALLEAMRGMMSEAEQSAFEKLAEKMSDLADVRDVKVTKDRHGKDNEIYTMIVPEPDDNTDTFKMTVEYRQLVMRLGKEAVALGLKESHPGGSNYTVWSGAPEQPYLVTNLEPAGSQGGQRRSRAVVQLYRFNPSVSPSMRR